ATLTAYANGEAADLPLWRMGLVTLEELETRAGRIASRINDGSGAAGVKAEVIVAGAVSGGGSLPGGELPSRAVAITHSERSTAEIERALRHGDPPVVGRIDDDQLLLDIRTVAPESDDVLIDLVTAALG
nr:L-seryl-tRNA(Sec) selenium transferase [Actinomycetota bacterium]